MTTDPPPEPRLTITHDLGATRIGDRDWTFLVWAPDHDELSVRVYADGAETSHALEKRRNGYFAGDLQDLGDAPTYRYVLPDGTELADPASRWQPEGVHGPSRGFDPSRFEWSDQLYVLPPLSDTVIYELHVGTFTDAGTLDAAIAHLDELVELGVTAVEPMPVAAFPGTHNWGYDGVFPFAVQDSYGGPAALQRFVDACHQRGLGVFLDVVYNHLGPEGNVLAEFGPYFTDVYDTPWGAAVNVSEAGSDEVRRYFIENAVMWLRDFRFDGLRLDAVHGIVDPTASPFLAELTTAVGRLATELDRRLILIAESADNNPLVVTPVEAGGQGFDAQWTDDFHHSLHVALTGEQNGYYQDYESLDDLATAFTDGFVYSGQYSAFRGRRHGVSSVAVPRDRFVVYTQNHDQIGNRAGGERLITLVGPDAARLAAGLLLLSPFVPMLFMGEEHAETTPFPYFIDHGNPELVEAVRSGRAEEFGRDADAFDPADPKTFQRARLDRSSRESDTGRGMLSLYRGLLSARRDHPVLTIPQPLDFEATATGSALTTTRRSAASMAFAAFNVGTEEASVLSNVSAQRWLRVLDSADPALGGDGAWHPGELGAAEEIRLAPYGFCLYIAAPAEGNAS